MKKELADYIVIAIRALPAGLVFLAIGMLLIRVTGDTETWGWVPVLGYIIAYLRAAGERWNIDNATGGSGYGRKKKCGAAVQTQPGLCSAPYDGRAA